MWNKILLTSMLFALTGQLFASTYMNQVRKYNSRTEAAFRITKSTGIVNIQKDIQIPLRTGYLGSATAADLSFSSAPGLEAEAASDSMVLDWADGEETPVIYSIRVPADYNSDGSVILEAISESNVTTNTVIRIAGKINGGTPASATASVTTGSFEDVTVDLGSSLLTLTPGDDLTILIDRVDASSGTGTLQIKNIIFRYNDSMTLE